MMMTMLSSRFIKFLLFSFLAVAIPAVALDDGSDPYCPTVNHYVAPMHQDTACDLAGQNQYKASLGRADIHRRLKETGTRSVPDQKTEFCPQTVQALTSSNFQTGFDTSWIVENTATLPVVVAFLLERPDGTYAEVSAFDHNIAPPNYDVKAILKPGEWKSVMALEGQVYHVREILKDGSMGMILMQHRVGMVPIRNKYGHDIRCDPTDPDPEPVVVQNEVVERAPEYARKLAAPIRPCNVIDVGFRNMLGCPVNGYYTGHYAAKGLAKPRGNVTEWKEKLTRFPKSCHEVFEFHLGLNEHTNDFMWDWNSNTKYESAYIGQNFVFRLAKDERVVVDSYSLHTTKVIDCPGLKNQVNVVTSLPTAQMIVDPIANRHGLFLLPHRIKNLNGTMNATSWVLPSPSTLQIMGGVSERTAGTKAHTA